MARTKENDGNKSLGVTFDVDHDGIDDSTRFSSHPRAFEECGSMVDPRTDPHPHMKCFHSLFTSFTSQCLTRTELSHSRRISYFEG